MRQPFGQLRLPKGCLVWPLVNKVVSGHTSLEESPHSAGPLGGRRVRRSLGAAFCGRGPCPRPRMVAPLPRCRGVALARPSPPLWFYLPVGVLLGVQVRQSRLAKMLRIILRLLLNLPQVCQHPLISQRSPIRHQDVQRCSTSAGPLSQFTGWGARYGHDQLALIVSIIPARLPVAQSGGGGSGRRSGAVPLWSGLRRPSPGVPPPPFLGRNDCSRVSSGLGGVLLSRLLVRQVL